jgi:hypothetical protein
MLISFDLENNHENLETQEDNPFDYGLVSRFLHGHQVFNLTEGHHPLGPILWASILEDIKLLGVIGAKYWVVWIH